MTNTIAFIGGGNMATSLVGGLVASGHRPDDIWVSDPVPARREELSARFRVHAVADNEAAVAAADTVVLAVKPQVMESVVLGIASAAEARRPLVISIAAGIREPSIRRWLGYEAAVVRTMPNTPALVGCGATALFANPSVTSAQRETAQTILGAAGITRWVDDEGLLDAVTALSGSGPAYFFLLMESMIKAGVGLGLPEPAASELTLQTALGAARMALEGDEGPATLRERVTSPGGTTERALGIFRDGGFEDLVQAALTGARDRSRELAGDD